MERYADDEQRSRTKQIRPALRVAAAGRRLLRRSLNPAAWRWQRGSRGVAKPALKFISSALLASAGRPPTATPKGVRDHPRDAG